MTSLQNPSKTNPSHRRVGIRNISDYSPFGVLLKERTIETVNFRYGFQGQESDDEVKGEGNYINFKYRGYDPRIGRFWSPDPKETEFPWQSTYCYAANSPIYLIDEEGAGPIVGLLRFMTWGNRVLAVVTGKTIKQSVSASFFAGIPSLGVGGKGEVGVAVDKRGNIGFYGSGDVFADATLFGEQNYKNQSAPTHGAFSLGASATVTASYSFSKRDNVTELAGPGLGGVGVPTFDMKIKGAYGLAGGLNIGEDELGGEVGVGIGGGLSNISSSTFVFATTLGELNKLENNIIKATAQALKKNGKVTYSEQKQGEWTTLSAQVSYTDKKGKAIIKEYNLISYKGSKTKNLIETKGVKKK
ncbi:MAG: RHS repeat-associated core domain-containing protein [Bacteroidetes bacterium]|nr:MAG: RHS repeat-associated core domain-containing protein [Bacteroidota bacterium]